MDVDAQRKESIKYFKSYVNVKTHQFEIIIVNNKYAKYGMYKYRDINYLLIYVLLLKINIKFFCNYENSKIIEIKIAKNSKLFNRI